MSKSCDFRGICCDPNCKNKHPIGTNLKKNFDESPYTKYRLKMKSCVVGLKAFHPVYGFITLVMEYQNQFKDSKDPIMQRKLCN